MRVFAQKISDNNNEYRINTLLQFGESWQHIGNVVLINPGNAKSTNALSNATIRDIEGFYKNNQIPFKGPKEWHEYNTDPTMQQIEKIFSGYYYLTDNSLANKQLNGVVQLFNVFNLRNACQAEALKFLNSFDKTDHKHKPPYLVNEQLEHKYNNAPTYFGFGGNCKSPISNNLYRDIAQQIFKNAPPEIKKNYNEIFDDNKFYHPRYVNCSYNKNRDILKPILRDCYSPLTKTKD